MDSILTQYLRYFTLTLKDSGENIQEIKTQLERESLKLIADGTISIFNDFLNNDKMSEPERKRMAGIIAAKFPGLFITDEKTGLPKLREEDRVSIKKMHEKGKHINQPTKGRVYSSYAFYSKYDHVSHWTSIFGNIPWEERLRRVHMSIINIMYNFRDLLALGHWQESVGPYCPSLVKILDDHMNHWAPDKWEII